MSEQANGPVDPLIIDAPGHRAVAGRDNGGYPVANCTCGWRVTGETFRHARTQARMHISEASS